ncbi:MAG: sigma-54 dependent transcriptional regulator [Myxococcota bacterium]|nr:sigma-54 dependent transcriptional regulator [Myxococcota bacterium]
MASETVMVVDDERSMREFLTILMERDGYEVAAVPSAVEALTASSDRWPDLVLTDLNMPGMDGLELLKELKARAARDGKDVEVVVITAFGTTESAVDAMRCGAADYVQKPFNNDELRLVVRRVLGRRELEVENLRLKGELQDRYHFGRLVGSSAAMMEVYDLIRRVKDTRINCMIVAESGTGKEMVARAIHFSGVRADGPFIPINCGAIPENLVESELFGHVKGSFTGAVRDKTGLLKAAHNGTIFLDEIAMLPPSAQVSLLRALQERRFTPVGAVREIEVDVRVIAATNVDLEAAVARGEFREDLYYRLNVVQMKLPPLRERGEDIPELVRFFLHRYAKEYSKEIQGLAPDASRSIRSWNYPGNVRELQNIIERAVALCKGPEITAEDLPERMSEGRVPIMDEQWVGFPEGGIDLDALLSSTEKNWLLAALEVSGGNKTKAANLLHMTFRSLRYRLVKYGLDGDGSDLV